MVAFVNREADEGWLRLAMTLTACIVVVFGDILNREKKGLTDTF